jgi:hypothetical protein
MSQQRPGSSRNVDLKYLRGQTNDISTLKDEYLNFFAKGVDIIETDIPVQLGPLVNPYLPIRSAVKKFYKKKSF